MVAYEAVVDPGVGGRCMMSGIEGYSKEMITGAEIGQSFRVVRRAIEIGVKVSYDNSKRE